MNADVMHDVGIVIGLFFGALAVCAGMVLLIKEVAQRTTVNIDFERESITLRKLARQMNAADQLVDDHVRWLDAGQRRHVQTPAPTPPAPQPKVEVKPEIPPTKARLQLERD
jgi:hypothetical protein